MPPSRPSIRTRSIPRTRPRPGDSGAKGAAAVKRYRTDAVKQVEAMQTTSGGGSATIRGWPTNAALGPESLQQ